MAIVNVGGAINNSSAVANLDYKYGPYTSVEQAFAALEDVLAVGLTVGIKPTATSAITEYWFKSACAAATDLVPKDTNGLTAVIHDGTLTGNGTENTPLAVVTTNFVNTYGAQSIGGEKTFSDNIKVSTGKTLTIGDTALTEQNIKDLLALLTTVTTEE